MAESDTVEIVLRVAAYPLLGGIIYTWVVLNRLLRSKAWRRMTTGFVIIGMYIGSALVLDVVPIIPFLIARFVAFAYILWGARTLLGDVLRLRSLRMPPSDPLVSTTEEV
jgi:hypothetical protein